MTERRRLVIAGLDGATWDVLDGLLASGRIPTLAGLIQRGHKSILRSTWPPISSAAWVTMLSGLNPGRHGIYDFRNLDLSQYSGHDEQLANANSYPVPTLFDYLSQAGLPSVAYQVPMTYPPWPIRGVMVAGYPTPDHRRPYTHPPAWASQLGQLYSHSPDQIGAANPAGQFAIYCQAMQAMTDQLLTLSQAVDWQLFMFVNGVTDGAQHRFFKFTRPDFPGVSAGQRQRYGHFLAEIMVRADQELGRLLAALPNDLNIMVISDHGAMPRPSQAFHLNAWLREAGWLRLRPGGRSGPLQNVMEWAKQRLPITDWVKKRLPAALKSRFTSLRDGLGRVDWANTAAYRVKLSHPIEGVHLNMAGRQPQGLVPAGQYHSLRQKIMDKLATRPEIKAVYPREAIYAGPYLEQAPDILCQLQPQFDGGSGFEQLVTKIPAGWLQAISGYHNLDGILITAGPDFKSGPAISAPQPMLQDVTPTALHLLGLPVPNNMDGRVWQELLTHSRPVLATTPLPNRPQTIADLSPAETAGLQVALKSLGYLDNDPS